MPLIPLIATGIAIVIILSFFGAGFVSASPSEIKVISGPKRTTCTTWSNGLENSNS